MKLKGFRARLMVQATEDIVRVRTAFEDLVGQPATELAHEGYWKNPLTLLEAHGGPEEARKILINLQKLHISDFLDHCEKNQFFIRVDKEGLLSGQILPGQSDGLQLIFEFEGHAPTSSQTASAVRALWSKA
ncbi:MAG TPA: hypothetical protein ENN60_02570 [archaeon]|nr:hypothetical protein [archaeon]